ncbi:hypothetical protein EJ08DRAFT_682869 [Tothia fuscella]|uniref:Cupredoxin n=1 Tax=Tothia fuscella TaxID=1048955 RepID=A0A9P4NHT9_9PEZI|nr:hypothetical protein EJ08DRAFT_682869 [Tothia fuscella]
MNFITLLSMMFAFMAMQFPGATATMHMIEVGYQGTTFSPTSLFAVEGDTVQFRFVSIGHDVAQGVYDKPCYPSTDNNSFYSGKLGIGQTFTVDIKNGDSLWLYDTTFCNMGMVAVINPSSYNASLSQYRQAAVKTETSIAPEKVQNGTPGNFSTSATTTSAVLRENPPANATTSPRIVIGASPDRMVPSLAEIISLIALYGGIFGILLH